MLQRFDLAPDPPANKPYIYDGRQLELKRTQNIPQVPLRMQWQIKYLL